MKKIIALALALSMSLPLAACGGGGQQSGAPGDGAQSSSASPGGGGALYVLGPAPDCGWTGQAGACAEAKCRELTGSGSVTAKYISASSGREQAAHCRTIVANGDAALVVMMALDDSARAGLEALHAGDIPFITFDPALESAEKYALLNVAGDNRQCGAGIACWLQKNGMQPGDTVMVLCGDSGGACSLRQEGFQQFLRGELQYQDGQTGSCGTAETWTQEQLDALFSGYVSVCGWSADGAYSCAEQSLDKVVAAAKDNGGKLYICSMDDELTLGVLNYLESGASAATLADLKALDVYISAAGGMRELYDVMAGAGRQSALAGKYFDGMMSMYFSPGMIQDAIDAGVEYLAGSRSWEAGSVEYRPTWIVDAGNVSQFEGFQGRCPSENPK